MTVRIFLFHYVLPNFTSSFSCKFSLLVRYVLNGDLNRVQSAFDQMGILLLKAEYHVALLLHDVLISLSNFIPLVGHFFIKLIDRTFEKPAHIIEDALSSIFCHTCLETLEINVISLFGAHFAKDFIDLFQSIFESFYQKIGSINL